MLRFRNWREYKKGIEDILSSTPTDELELKLKDLVAYLDKHYQGVDPSLLGLMEFTLYAIDLATATLEMIVAEKELELRRKVSVNRS